MATFLILINLLYYIFVAALIIRVILSWFTVRPDNPFLVIVYQLTEPILAPMRRITPRIGMIDITPMLTIILLNIIIQLLNSQLS